MISIRISLLVIIFSLAAVELAWKWLGLFSVDVRLYGAIMHLILAF